jgi:predicted RNase H-like nuclease
MSRWMQSRQLTEVLNIKRQILDANEAVDAARAAEVRAAREKARSDCLVHDRVFASVAVRTGADAADREFRKLLQRARAGGYHAERHRAGGELDRLPEHD